MYIYDTPLIDYVFGLLAIVTVVAALIEPFLLKGFCRTLFRTRIAYWRALLATVLCIGFHWMWSVSVKYWANEMSGAISVTAGFGLVTLVVRAIVYGHVLVDVESGDNVGFGKGLLLAFAIAVLWTLLVLGGLALLD